MRCSRWMVCAGVLALVGGYETAVADSAGTEFTYQGQLKQAGFAAEGDFDFLFRLYNAAQGGTQVGGDFTLNDWPVHGGLFTAPLDFGVGMFDGTPRWLEVAVRPGTSGNPYTVLSPRQPITAAPMALYALDGPGSGGHWAAGGLHIFNTNSGNVGVGTSSPLEKLHVAGAAANLRLQDDDDPASYLVIRDTGPAQALFEKHRASGNTLMDFAPRPLDGVGNASIRLFRSTNTTGFKQVVFHRGNNTTATSAVIGVDGTDSVFQLDGGNFGIGTLTPDTKLTVNGPVSSLSGGYKFPDGTVQVTAATGGTGFWSANGAHIYNNNAGSVGVGTSSPSSKLHVRELGSGNPSPAARIGLQWFQPMDLNDWFSIEVGGLGVGTGSSPRLVREAGTALYFQTEAQMNATERTTQMMLDPDGKLGLGTTSPTSLLEAVSTTGVHGIRATTTAIPVAAFRTSTSGSWPAVHAESASSSGDATAIRGLLTSASPGSGSAAVLGQNQGTTLYGYGVKGSHAGYGTGVYGVSVGGVGVHGASTDGFGVYGKSTNSYAGYFDGKVQATVLEIAGADVAEKFPVSEQVKPGMVVMIDAENPGKLCLARGAYNRRVAGVVSGAGDIPTGAILGNLPGHQDAPAIALTGRVWVYADAAEQPIAPGDLLTTAARPGHAMKVTDHEKAPGAVLGKAMTGLDEGTGLVLVLVSLQ